MKCKYCNVKNLEGATICKKCGKSLKNKIEDSKSENSIDQPNNINNSLDTLCHCGKKIESDSSFCPECGGPITDKKESITNEKEQEINVAKEDKVSIYIIIYIFSMLLSLIGIPWICLIAIFIIILAKIKYPKNKIITGLFWYTIIMIIISIVFVFVFLKSCGWMY
ncbi:MAG: zinc ribbon domain-containing protein [Bacilli bacterium]